MKVGECNEIIDLVFPDFGLFYLDSVFYFINSLKFLSAGELIFKNDKEGTPTFFGL